MLTMDEMNKELETKSEPEVMQSMAAEMVEAILATMNVFLDTNGGYRHPGVSMSAVLEVLMIVVQATTPEEEWEEMVEMITRQMEMIMEARKDPVPKNSDLEPDQLAGGENG